MADQPPRKRPPDAFASFDNGPGAGGRRRKTTWPLRPMREPNAGEAYPADRVEMTEAVIAMTLLAMERRAR